MHICGIFAILDCRVNLYLRRQIISFGNSYAQLTAEPIILVIVANDSIFVLSSGVYPTKAFPLF